MTQDFDKARSLARQAVADGLEPAKGVLAYLALNGIGEEKDAAKGRRLLDEAAAAGDPSAAFSLARMLKADASGKDDERSRDRRVALLRQAAGREYTPAYLELGEALVDVAKASGAKEDKEAAVGWLKKAADSGDPLGKAYMGWAHANGFGVVANQKTASEEYLAAAKLGNSFAQWQIGERLLTGTGIAADASAGKSWLEKAATAGRKEAKATLERLAKPDGGNAIANLVFPTAGYSSPEFFKAIFDGRTKNMRLSQFGLYLTSFLSMFTNAEDVPECRSVVSQATLYRIAGAGSADVLGQIFGGLAQAHRNRGGGRDGAFSQGFNAGAGTFGGMMLSEASAKADAQLFYDRHGCKSPVARRFFGNISNFAAQN